MSKVTLRLHVSGCPSLTASVELAADTPWEGVLDACRRALATESATNFRYMCVRGWGRVVLFVVVVMCRRCVLRAVPRPQLHLIGVPAN